MIYDHISNIHLYQSLSPEIAAGLNFLAHAAPDLQEGSYTLLSDTHAGVQAYTTRKVNENGFEAHRKYIDIQFLLQGREEIRVRPLTSLSVTQLYDDSRDVLFAADDGAPSIHLPLGDGFFVILYPQDAHTPQLALNQPQLVKKVVVKVPVLTR